MDTRYPHRLCQTLAGRLETNGDESVVAIKNSKRQALYESEDVEGVVVHLRLRDDTIAAFRPLYEESLDESGKLPEGWRVEHPHMQSQQSRLVDLVEGKPVRFTQRRRIIKQGRGRSRMEATHLEFEPGQTHVVPLKRAVALIDRFPLLLEPVAAASAAPAPTDAERELAEIKARIAERGIDLDATAPDDPPADAKSDEPKAPPKKSRKS